MAQRKPFIAGNWKMFKTREETRVFFQALPQLGDEVDVAVAPPFTALETAVEAARGTRVGVYAQNVHWEDDGAFTGEISAPMLNEIGVDGVIIGHSERRQYFGETDETVNKRLRAALRHNLKPIVCVGEVLEQRRGGDTLKVIEQQLEGAFEGLGPSEAINVVIAYEPVWAIGTGETATPEQAQEVHAYIREWLGKRFGPDAPKQMRIQYGGSVKPENARTLLEQEDIDGALVGGASLDAEKRAQIIRFGSDKKFS